MEMYFGNSSSRIFRQVPRSWDSARHCAVHRRPWNNDELLHADAIRRAHDEAVAAGRSTYIDPLTGYSVFTEAHHLGRGECCASRCRHCPY